MVLIKIASGRVHIQFGGSPHYSPILSFEYLQRMTVINYRGKRNLISQEKEKKDREGKLQ